MNESPNPVPIRFVLGTAVALLVALSAIGYFTDLGRPETVVFEGPLRVSSLPAGEQADDEPPPITLSPPFEVSGPTTLRLELRRSESPGWVGVSCSLLNEETGELREFPLHSDHRPPTSPQLTADVLVDQVATGRYTLRFDPAWQPVTAPQLGQDEPAAVEPPSVVVRATEGSRSWWGFGIAALLIIAPALFEIARYYRHRRGRRGAVAVAAGSEPPEETLDKGA